MAWRLVRFIWFDVLDLDGTSIGTYARVRLYEFLHIRPPARILSYRFRSYGSDQSPDGSSQLQEQGEPCGLCDNNNSSRFGHLLLLGRLDLPPPRPLRRSNPCQTSLGEFWFAPRRGAFQSNSAQRFDSHINFAKFVCNRLPPPAQHLHRVCVNCHDSPRLLVVSFPAAFDGNATPSDVKR